MDSAAKEETHFFLYIMTYFCCYFHKQLGELFSHQVICSDVGSVNVVGL